MREVEFSAVYSKAAPMMLELVRAIPDTIWHTGSPGDVHHLGYWADDIGERAAEARGKGVHSSGVRWLPRVSAAVGVPPTAAVRTSSTSPEPWRR